MNNGALFYIAGSLMLRFMFWLRMLIISSCRM